MCQEKDIFKATASARGVHKEPNDIIIGSPLHLNQNLVNPMVGVLCGRSEHVAHV